MLEKLENRQKEIQNECQIMNQQVKMLVDNLEQSKAQLHQILGKHEEITKLIEECKTSDLEKEPEEG